MARKLIAGGAAYTVKSRVDHDAVIQTATDNAVITLPATAPANKGQKITVQVTAANGGALVSVSPAAADALIGGVMGAATGVPVFLSGTVNKDLQFTKATQKKGDYVTLVSDGVAGGGTWSVIGGSGVVASEA
jgi:hypothetical protein